MFALVVGNIRVMRADDELVLEDETADGAYEEEHEEEIKTPSAPQDETPDKPDTQDALSQESDNGKDDDGGKGSDDKKGSDEPKDIIYKLTPSSAQISLGTVASGEEPRPQSFTITNNGSAPVSLNCNPVCSEEVFGLNIPDINVPLQSGSSISCTVYAIVKNLHPGDFKATIQFTDNSNPKNNATVTASLKVVDSTPKVTGITVSPKSTSVPAGSVVSFSSKVKGNNDPDTGVNWAVQGNRSSGTSIDADGTLKIADNEEAGTLTVIATSRLDSNFKDTASVQIQDKPKNSYAVTASVDPKKSGSVTGVGTYKDGEYATLTAVAVNGYEFAGWVDKNGNSVSLSRTFTTPSIHADVLYTARFTKGGFEVKVKSDDKNMGKVEGGGYVDYDGSITVKASPKSGYLFSGWYEKNKLVSKDEKFKVKNVKADHSYTAYFRAEKHTVGVTASPSEGGSVGGAGKYKDGDSVKITCKANKGYVYKGLVLNNKVVTTASEYTVKKLDRDLSFTAYFEKEGVVTYTITAGVANAGGVISPNGKQAISAGQTITYLIAPDNGYEILAVAVDGKQIGAVNQYTFKDIKADHTIAAAFAPKAQAVVKQKMDKIISTEEAEAIASARLEAADSNAEGRNSSVLTPEEYAASQGKATEETVETVSEIVEPGEQYLVGMDDTEGLADEVTEEYSYDDAQGLYGLMNMTPATAEARIDAGADEDIIRAAYDEGYLDVVINNEYVVPGHENESSEIFEDETTVKNIMTMVKTALNKDDKLSLCDGNDITLSFFVSTDTSLNDDYKKIMANGAEGVDIDRYFQITLVKSAGGYPELITEIKEEAEFTLQIPEEVRQEGRDYCIVRNHNGEITLLKDLDNDPNTITIRTDRFSPYAFAHYTKSSENKSTKAGGLWRWVIIFTAVLAAIVLTMFVASLGSRNKRKRRNRHGYKGK